MKANYGFKLKDGRFITESRNQWFYFEGANISYEDACKYVASLHNLILTKYKGDLGSMFEFIPNHNITSVQRLNFEEIEPTEYEHSSVWSPD